MAHSYTARQLDFFKSTLKIIESALFEAESVAITQQSDQPAPAAIESAPSIMAVAERIDSHSVSRALFSVMPLPDELEQNSVAFNPAIEPAVISLSHVKNSKAFFSELPWHAVSSQSAPISHTNAPVARTANVIATATPPNCTAFFSALPWQVKPSHAAEPIASVSSDAPEHALIESTENAAFFKTMPWQGAGESIASVIETSQPTITTTPDNSCLNFFTHLPWQGQLVSDTSGDLHSDEFATIAALATQSALTAASRAVNQASAPTATRFFQALPW